MVCRVIFMVGLLALTLLSPVNARTQHVLTVASNPTLALSNDEVDEILTQMNATMATSKYSPWDVPCDVKLVRNGDVIQSNQLPLQGDYNSLISSLHKIAPSANVLVVSGIDCSGIVAAGCGLIGGEPLVVGQYQGYDSQLWLHERGHNVGLQHSAEAPAGESTVPQNVGMRFMFWQLGIGHVGKIASECDKYQEPSTHLASVVQVQAPAVPPAPAPAAATLAPSEELATAARSAGLTPKAYEVVGPPWVHGMPLGLIKQLSQEDIQSIRSMLSTGVPNPAWPQAIDALAVVGTAEDVKLVQRALNLPVAAVGPGASKESVAEFRNLLRLKLSAPIALGIIANRTQSESAVETLSQIAQVENATKLVGEGAANALSKSALNGLAVANTPAAAMFLNSTLGIGPVPGPQIPQPNNPPLPGAVAPLSPEEVERTKTTVEDVKQMGIERFLTRTPNQ
jgi:hypothetical protein